MGRKTDSWRGRLVEELGSKLTSAVAEGREAKAAVSGLSC